MKHFRFFTVLSFVSAFSFNERMVAQTTVDSQTLQVWNTNTCSVPQDGYVYSYSFVHGYQSTDIPNFHVDFGDGNFVDVPGLMYYYNATTYEAYLNTVQHTYAAAGIYIITSILTMPDGNADTTYSQLMITSTCNNVSGRLYEDVNSNCVYDAGDIAVSYANVLLNYNSYMVGNSSCDAQGIFTFSAVPGYTYNLLTDTTNGPAFSLSCSAFQGMPVTPSPTATQDIPVLNITSVHIQFAGDSASFFAGNCVPLSGYCYMNGSTLNYYSPADSIDVYMNFGDGQDTAGTFPIYNNQGPVANFYASFPHTYTAPGSYNVLYVATGPDGRSDTVTRYNEINVMDTCGNIQGDLYIDNNGNCVFDTGDSAMAWVPIIATNTSTGWHTYAYADMNGHYSIDVGPGNYTVALNSYMLSYALLTPTCPASASVTVTVTASNTTTQDFGLTCSGNYDFSGHFGMWPGIWPSYTTHIHTYVSTLSCSIVPGSVTFILDPLVHYVGVCDTAFTPTVNGDTLTWTFTSQASYYYWWYYWYQNHGCISVQGDPSLQLGDTVCFTMIVDPIAGDINPSNNTIQRCVPALVALDPNVKDVMPLGNGPLGYIPQLTPLNYTINFQNTGTAPARDVFVLDTLDNDLDLSTLVITGASHPMTIAVLPGNVLRFYFDEINLADSTSDEPHSHGWVSYRIVPKNNLADGTPIQNTAGIYFDFNAPVITNSTLNTIYDPAAVHEIFSTDELGVYPVPADQFLKLELATTVAGDVSLMDISGRMLRKETFRGSSVTIDTSSLSDGVYIVTINDGTSVISKMIVVQH